MSTRSRHDAGAKLLARIDRLLGQCRAMRCHGGGSEPKPRRTPKPGDDWAPWERAYLSRMAGTKSQAEIGAVLGRSRTAVNSWAQRHGKSVRRFWTSAEDQVVREGRAAGETAKQIAQRLPGRTADGVENRLFALGLTRGLVLGPDFDAFVREKHALAWTDTETAAAWNQLHPADDITRECVGARRRKAGLSHNAWSQRQRDRVAAKTKEQLAAAGLPSLAALHRKVVQDRIQAMGWPADLRYREAQILCLIWDRGPLTMAEICVGIGKPWRGKGSLKSNGPGGTYTADLIQRGLLICIPRACKVTGRGKGRSRHVYSLPLTIQRRRVG